ncbi:hypothetical protein M0D46_05150 [Xanthomonas prunicola]|uniref:hypothetical protein n=1 Tax=Xanthomonas prunicola TaxID=2053930 RepID=UPI0021B3590D|nr:hypothetical protein [Xanthomonas prunicola]UXA51827.1 hypothetical protein M0D45_13985 [Xanthomonas prunicola]UXA70454.1 hypothetical protein M0D46_05150 [Xanthomonas prunicola]
MPIANDRVRFAVMALAICLIVGCSMQSPPANTPIAKEQSGMQSAVPFTRSLPSHDGEEMVLEFEVPALPDDTNPPIFVGVLLTGSDTDAVADVAERLGRADVVAVVHLEHTEQAGSVPVELLRSQRVGREQEKPVKIAVDGIAKGLFALNADVATMENAGLPPRGMVSEELAFAYSTSLPSGRYRLRLRIDQNRQVLVDANAQLLIAYTHKAK